MKDECYKFSAQPWLDSKSKPLKYKFHYLEVLAHGLIFRNEPNSVMSSGSLDGINSLILSFDKVGRYYKGDDKNVDESFEFLNLMKKYPSADELCAFCSIIDIRRLFRVFKTDPGFVYQQLLIPTFDKQQIQTILDNDSAVDFFKEHA